MSLQSDLQTKVRVLEGRITLKSIEVRDLQIEYFQHRSTGTLHLSKTAERELDSLHKQYKTAVRQRDGKEAVPGNLFE